MVRLGREQFTKQLPPTLKTAGGPRSPSAERNPKHEENEDIMFKLDTRLHIVVQKAWKMYSDTTSGTVIQEP